MTGRDQIEAAAARIAPRVRRTPVLRVQGAELGLTPPITFKMEFLQHTGSFKPRGAFNRMLSEILPAAGVIAASGGNHGAAVAYAARALGVPAEIFVPATAPAAKVARIASYGARIVQIGASYNEAMLASQARRDETGALEVHAYDHPDVLAGQGTVGREFEQDAPALTHVLVATGGGGLIGGIAAWYAGARNGGQRGARGLSGIARRARRRATRAGGGGRGGGRQPGRPAGRRRRCSRWRGPTCSTPCW